MISEYGVLFRKLKLGMTLHPSYQDWDYDYNETVLRRQAKRRCPVCLVLFDSITEMRRHLANTHAY